MTAKSGNITTKDTEQLKDTQKNYKEKQNV